METHVNLAAMQQLFEKANNEKRDYLYEYEVYDFIRFVGSETPPQFVFQPKGTRLSEETLNSISGNKIVIKIVSPYILHKSDVGGVRIVEKDPQKVLSTIRKMMVEIPEKYADIIERNPAHAPGKYKGLNDRVLQDAIAADIKGVILVQFMEADSQEFGNELLVSLRNTREFGMILSAGLGGTDTELYAQSFKKGQAVVAASTEMVDGNTFFELFKQTISYKKLAGLTRGQKRIVTDDQLLECFTALIETAKNFSPDNPKAKFIIEEMEINPFAFTDYLMLPLDGLGRFSLPKKIRAKRPIEKLDKLLHPTTIGLAGVSAKGDNMGKIILKNILDNGYDQDKITLIHPKVDQIDGVKAVPSLRDLKEKVDLLILGVSAKVIPNMVDDIIDHDLAETVLLIPGGLGEVQGNENIKLELQEKIQSSRNQKDSGPIFLGGNSLGILSHPGRYDALFIPESKLPIHRGEYVRKSAMISQSGAYMITRMSKLKFFDPAYALSIGNQLDLTASDILNYLNTIEDIKTAGFYMEGFTDLDGLEFAKAVQQAVKRGKEVVFYKAGRTPEGKSATSGHTASIAGDYMVCESCIDQAGAIVADTFTSFEGLMKLSRAFHNKKISGNRLAAVSNAGYESVGIADNILGEDFELVMASFSEDTEDKISTALKKAHLDALSDVKNPMDITPMASETVYESVIRAMLEDDSVDAVVAAAVPLTPILHTLPDEKFDNGGISSEQDIIKIIPKLAAESDKPLIMVVDSGTLFDPLADALQDGGVPVFRSADQAVLVLGKYINGRLSIQKLE